ncbi:MAG: c-type cytochrome [Sphingobacteriales bacterium]|nr:c-type cytochrome [Sphingobacteriales bacterium]
MLQKKKIIIFLACFAFVGLGVAAIKAPAFQDRNLKVLPLDIPDQKLDSLMETYTRALGVNCSFCHTRVTGFPDSLDFRSDTEPMKENARDMIRMTILINKTHFYFDKNTRPEYLHTVSCMTCHRGQPFPPEY